MVQIEAKDIGLPAAEGATPSEATAGAFLVRFAHDGVPSALALDPPREPARETPSLAAALQSQA